MSNELLHPIPPSWLWVTMGDLGRVVAGGTPSTTDPANFGGDIPWLTPADLSGYSQKFIAKGERNITAKGLQSSSAILLPAGSVLFSSRAPVGYTVIASNEIATNQGFKNLVPSQGIFNEYAYHYLKGNKALAERYASGTTFLEVSGKNFARIPIPLPPLPEQKRIVTKIEELFSDLDAGVEALKKAQAQLKRYRQSVLKAAFGGKLTQEWREKQKGKIEPASVLLERIREERKKTLGKKYKEPEPVDTAGLPELPKGWEWASANDIFARITDGEHITPQRADKGVYLLSARNVLNGRLSLDNVDYVSQSIYETLSKRLTIEAGDVLLSCSGTVGRSCVAPEGLVFSLVRSVAVLKPLFGMGNFCSLALRTPALQEQINEKKTQTAQANIFQGKICALVFPLPPLAEQQRIVEEIEDRFSLVDKTEEIITQALKQAARLRQSILKKAFEGKLVPQDPKDEPADKLLERIKAEKEKKEGTASRARSPRKPRKNIAEVDI